MGVDSPCCGVFRNRLESPMLGLRAPRQRDYDNVADGWLSVAVVEMRARYSTPLAGVQYIIVCRVCIRKIGHRILCLMVVPLHP
mmetsp:Transcript_37175/g.61579  ORF Transcript_37175/g.61579 Transcript_37175/m.61579 type:complete len:84 (+) Transcript_37175:1918-2169(+)